MMLLDNEESLKHFLRKKITPKYYKKIERFIVNRIPTYIILAVTIFAFIKFDIANDLTYEKGDDYFSKNYINPADIKINKKNPKNLILIYVESLENTYSNKDLFQKDLLQSLNSHKKISFDNFVQVPGTGWTMAGMTASQCGIPLKALMLEDINLQGERLKSFLPNAVCLGDSLKKLGYKNIFLGGAPLEFAGKGKFLKSHGYDEIYGRDDWLASGRYNESDMNNWGLQDDDLFSEAKTQLDQLISSKKLFNLTLLTVNTHLPKGFMSKDCAKKGGKAFQDIVSCAADEVEDFIQYAHQKGYLENTNIVIMGDHLAMQNPLYDKLKTVKNRTIFNLWISKNHIAKNRDETVHFDIAPSILEFIGFDIVGDRYGLGYSAFSHKKMQPNLNRIIDMEHGLLKGSKIYDHLWQDSL